MPFLIAFWKPIAAIVAIVALIAAVAWAKHSYDEGKREDGRAELRPKVAAAEARAANAEAANVELAANLAALQSTLTEQRRAVDKLKADTARAQRETKAALARIAAESARYAAEVDRLTLLAATPRAVPLTDAEDVAAATSIMREVMRGLMAEQLP